MFKFIANRLFQRRIRLYSSRPSYICFEGDDKTLKSPESLAKLQSRLAKAGPEYLPIYYLAKHIGEKKWEGAEIFDDSSMEPRGMEHPTTVLCHTPDALSDDPNIGSWIVYGEDESRLLAMLNKSQVTNRRLDIMVPPKKVIFRNLNDKFLPSVIQYMDNRGFKMDSGLSASFRFHHIPNLVLRYIEHVKLPSLPQGFVTGPLRPEHASLVASVSVLHSTNANHMVRKMIEELPSAAIYPPTQDEPVSFIQLQQHGMPSYVYTKPEYRNKGFLEICMQQAILSCSKKGYADLCCGVNDTSGFNALVNKLKNKPLHTFHIAIFEKPEQFIQ